MILMWSLSLLSGVFVLGLAVRINLWRRQAPCLPSALGETAVATTVLLPVRNGEVNVFSCIESLRSQHESVHIRVIDDGSSDRTVAIVREAMAKYDNVDLVEAGALPEGWRGKLHALHVGLSGVADSWILMTDADTRHQSGLLRSAHAAAEENRLDCVSVAGFQETMGLGEELLIPAVFALLDALLGDWGPAAKGEAAVANGQFMLVRRAALTAIGNLEAIRNEAIDDVALVTRMRRFGFRVGFFRGLKELRIRMYRGGGATVQGWRRNLGGLFGGKLLLSMTVLLVILWPLCLMALAWASGAWPAALFLWLCGSGASALVRKGSGHSPLIGFLYPVDVSLLAFVVAWGMLDFRRGRLAAWKGREMRV
jgi:glycosyltransferase involved in cell wall biosynthesis